MQRVVECLCSVGSRLFVRVGVPERASSFPLILAAGRGWGGAGAGRGGAGLGGGGGAAVVGLYWCGGGGGGRRPDAAERRHQVRLAQEKIRTRVQFKLS